MEQGRHGAHLFQSWRAQTCLSVFERCRHQILILGDQGSYSGPAGAVHFGGAFHHDRMLLESMDSQNRSMLLTIVHKFAVHFVRDEKKVVL